MRYANDDDLATITVDFVDDNVRAFDQFAGPRHPPHRPISVKPVIAKSLMRSRMRRMTSTAARGLSFEIQ
jgi:hypothetical protein